MSKLFSRLSKRETEIKSELEKVDLAKKQRSTLEKELVIEYNKFNQVSSDYNRLGYIRLVQISLNTTIDNTRL